MDQTRLQPGLFGERIFFNYVKSSLVGNRVFVIVSVQFKLSNRKIDLKHYVDRLKSRSTRSIKNNTKTYFRWWYSWASGDGKKGKWYPPCEICVEVIAIQIHIISEAKCEPIKTGPRVTGNTLEMRCSNQ